MSLILLFASSLITPASACAMERLEPVEVVAQNPTVQPPATLGDVFAEIDAAKAALVAPADIQRAVNQARSAVVTIPEVSAPPMSARPAT